MKIDILSLFPKMFEGTMTDSIIGKAQEKGLVTINTTDFRQYAENKHGHVDDYPYGGGAGMLLQVPPIYRALKAIDPQIETPEKKVHVVLLDPSGVTFTQKKAQEFTQYEHLVFICGHYEGYDERIRHYVDEEVSIGDYVLTGGELGAMVVIDATVRLLDEAVGNSESIEAESFSMGLLEYPQYTRPREFNGMTVPDVLLSGHHERIREWRHQEALKKTKQRRPDLLKNMTLTKEEQYWLKTNKDTC